MSLDKQRIFSPWGLAAFFLSWSGSLWAACNASACCGGGGWITGTVCHWNATCSNACATAPELPEGTLILLFGLGLFLAYRIRKRFNVVDDKA